MPHHVPRPIASNASRVGLFMLSCITFALLPVIFRDILTLRTGNVDAPTPANVQFLVMAITVIAGTLTVMSAFYGLYTSLFSRDIDDSNG